MKFKKIYIEITNSCNFNCKFCSKSNRKKKEMTVKEFEHIIKEIKPYTNYIYLHIKGEPLLHSNFENIIDICNKNNINVNITTNGSLISKRIDILKSPCIRQINISLQSYSDEKLLSLILDNTKLLSNNTSIVYRFWALDNYNLTEINNKIYKEILEYYKKNKVDDSLKNIEISKNVYINKSKLFEWPTIDSDEYSNNYCLGTKTHIGILSDGTVVPCCLDGEGIINLGNIHNERMEDILNSEKFLKISNSFRNNICAENLCLHCKYKNNFKKR